MTFSVKQALGNGGWLVAGAMAIGSLFAGGEVEPLERIDDLVAGSPAVVSLCPEGWADTSTSDGHVVVLSCSKDGWLVILDQSGQFQYAWLDGAPEFEEDKGKVEGWPQ